MEHLDRATPEPADASKLNPNTDTPSTSKKHSSRINEPSLLNQLDSGDSSPAVLSGSRQEISRQSGSNMGHLRQSGSNIGHSRQPSSKRGHSRQSCSSPGLRQSGSSP